MSSGKIGRFNEDGQWLMRSITFFGKKEKTCGAYACFMKRRLLPSEEDFELQEDADRDYYEKYPTVFHLRKELIESDHHRQFGIVKILNNL